MRYVSFLFFLTSAMANAQSALQFSTGDSLTFVLNSGNMYAGSKIERLVFVRNEDCVAIFWISSTEADPTPVLQNKMNISWRFLKDTLDQRLKRLSTMEEVFESHSHSYLSVYNNGRPLTIKEKVLRVLEKGTKSNTITVSTLGQYGYIEDFFNTLANGFKRYNIASCQYRKQKKIAEQGEH